MLVRDSDVNALRMNFRISMCVGLALAVFLSFRASAESSFVDMPISGKRGWNMSASNDRHGATVRSDSKDAAEGRVTNESGASQSAQCATQLKAFISELDELLPVAKSSDILQSLIARHFPLHGCDVDEAMAISRQSKHFDRIDNTYPRDVLIIFRYRIPRGWGFRVSFGLTRPDGNSQFPSAYVDKIK